MEASRASDAGSNPAGSILGSWGKPLLDSLLRAAARRALGLRWEEGVGENVPRAGRVGGCCECWEAVAAARREGAPPTAWACASGRKRTPDINVVGPHAERIARPKPHQHAFVRSRIQNPPPRRTQKDHPTK